MNHIQSKLRRLSGWIAAIAIVLSLQTSYAQENAPPVARLLEATPFVNETSTLSYVLFDEDNDVTDDLIYELYIYPDAGLASVDDIRTFALLIANEQDVIHETGSGHFVESSTDDDVQKYTWGDPGSALMSQGFAPADKVLPGNFYAYLVADDSVNDPVFAVSDFTIQVSDLVSTAVESSSWGQIKKTIP